MLEKVDRRSRREFAHRAKV